MFLYTKYMQILQFGIGWCEYLHFKTTYVRVEVGSMVGVVFEITVFPLYPLFSLYFYYVQSKEKRKMTFYFCNKTAP